MSARSRSGALPTRTLRAHAPVFAALGDPTRIKIATHLLSAPLHVGALAEQFFGLAIDPYPRKHDAALDSAGDDAAPAESEFQQKLRSLLGKS